MQDNTDAQYNLGLCYRNGKGVKRDMALAVKWCGRRGHGNPCCDFGRARACARVSARTYAWRMHRRDGEASARDTLAVG